MPKHILHRLLRFPLGAALLLAGCAPKHVATDRAPQAYYQTGFPSHDTSAELQQLFGSIKRVHVTGFFTTYRFALADSITEADARNGSALNRAIERFSFDHSKSGTGTMIARSGTNLTLITCDHVARLPDTLVVLYGEHPERTRGTTPSRYVESFTVRTGRRNTVAGFSDILEFSVVARDSIKDLALISVQLPEADVRADPPIVRVALGDAARLTWGSFVYVLGYPRGFSMVTRGIVSDPNRDRDHAFLLDGLFNRGISGGLILAVRSDTGSLEWVGVASAASADTEFLLTPERRNIADAGMLLPYEGRLYIERAARIEYGITFSVPSPAIRRFLDRAPVKINFHPE